MKTTISYSTAVLVIFSLLFFSCKTQQTLQSSTPKNQPEVVENPMPVEEKEEEPDTTKPAEVTKEELPEEVTIEEEIIKSDPPIAARISSRGRRPGCTRHRARGAQAAPRGRPRSTGGPDGVR